jgi:hypothetical protein
MAPVLQGERLDALRQGETIDTPAAGVVSAEQGVPLVECLVTRTGAGTGAKWRVLLVNKHRSRTAQGVVDLQGAGASSGRLQVLHAPDALRSDDARNLMLRQQTDLSPAVVANGTTRFSVQLPAACVAVLEVSAS